MFWGVGLSICYGLLSSCFGYLFLTLYGYCVHDLHLLFVKGLLRKLDGVFLGYWLFCFFLNLWEYRCWKLENFWIGFLCGVCRISNAVSFVIVLWNKLQSEFMALIIRTLIVHGNVDPINNLSLECTIRRVFRTLLVIYYCSLFIILKIARIWISINLAILVYKVCSCWILRGEEKTKTKNFEIKIDGN